MLEPDRWVAHKVVVASIDFNGTLAAFPEYDYRCDGINDEVEIIAAIEYVYHLWGDGIVQLTAGRYDADLGEIQKTIAECPGVIISG